MPDLISSQAPLKDPLVDTDTIIGYDTSNDELRAKLGVVEDAVWRRMFAAYASGKYVVAAEEGVSLTTSAVQATGIGTFVPFRVRRPTVIAKLCQRVVAAGVNMDLSIYASNNLTGRPTGSPIRSTGSFSSSTPANSYEISPASGGNLTIDYSGTGGTYYPGIFWMGMQTDSALLTLRAYPTTVPILAMFFGTSSLANAAGDGSNRAATGVSTPLSFGTWGDLTSAIWTELSGANAAKNFVPQYKVA